MDKYHIITSSKTPVEIKVLNITIMSKEKFKLLGIYINNGLNFNYYISQLCNQFSGNGKPFTLSVF